jgi:hypothetical protein
MAESFRSTRKLPKHQLPILVFFTMLSGFQVFLHYLKGTFGWLDWFILAVLAAGIGSVAFGRWQAKRLLDHLAACDWRCCYYCKFDLRGLPDSGKCPECGEPYAIEDVRRRWKDAWEIP